MGFLHAGGRWSESNTSAGQPQKFRRIAKKIIVITGFDDYYSVFVCLGITTAEPEPVGA
jgi:hypothetical protein